MSLLDTRLKRCDPPNTFLFTVSIQSAALLFQHKLDEESRKNEIKCDDIEAGKTIDVRTKAGAQNVSAVDNVLRL